jgi:hypothetical protein
LPFAGHAPPFRGRMLDQASLARQHVSREGSDGGSQFVGARLSMISRTYR